MGVLKARDAVLIDTNILIDYLDGYSEPRALLASVEGPAISIVSWIEVLAGARNEAEEALFKQFFEPWIVVPLDSEIADRAAHIRRQLRLKLPDAIILATAQLRHRKLLTRNTKDFNSEDADTVIPYALSKPSKRN